MAEEKLPPADVFKRLMPAKWRDVEFPITHLRMSLAHDLAEHKYWGVDGARVEATGMAPLRFQLTIPMHLGIVPGKGEGWKAGSLYPTVFRKLVTAFAKKQSGTLQHPEFGAIICKADKLEIDWAGDRRGGVEMQASFVETISDQELLLSIPRPNPVSDMAVAAASLDASAADLRKLAPKLPEYETTFADMMRGVQGVFDQATILSMRTAGKIDSIVFRAQQVGDSIDRARNALTWPATQNLERIKAAAHDLRQKLLQLGRDVVLYVTPTATTMAAIAAKLPDTSLGDLVKLNPQLMSQPQVPANTTIRYYASKLPV